ncbi:MAG: DUF3108 domain-containing protein [Bacteroidetes bacterium]|nr:DUF3108 domain-containing protein [Bacteroidota bacterium]MBU1579552.1 DUF3108 domain-containing protein [Bacteroidota bacterium]MBU2557484.1 DUF3108 domain-containing protein [Bacteroidota bacterium]
MLKKLLLLFFISVSISAFPQLRDHPNNAFHDKEFTRYSVYYSSMLTGNVVAGEATIEVKSHKKRFFDREVWHIVGEGKSKGAFNWFYKVRDRFESFVDKEALVPYLFIRRTREGDFVQDDDVYFYHEERKAVSRTATKAVPENIQDFVSALFFMRTLSLNDFDADSAYYLDFFLDDSVYVSKIKYQGTEYIKTSLGTFRCLKIAPMMATGEVFADAYPVMVWVTDDENHLPILAEAKIIVGSIKMELIEYKNILNPIHSLKAK